MVAISEKNLTGIKPKTQLFSLKFLIAEIA